MDEFKNVYLNVLKISEEKFATVKFIKKKHEEYVPSIFDNMINNFNYFTKYLEFDIFK